MLQFSEEPLLKFTYSSPSKYLTAPGGKVEGVKVLFTAAVILLVLLYDRRGVTSASNGK